MADPTDRYPVNGIDVVTDSQYIVEECTVCGGTHRHGRVPESMEPGDTIHRVAHCTDGTVASYVLRYTADTEVRGEGGQAER